MALMIMPFLSGIGSILTIHALCFAMSRRCSGHRAVSSSARQTCLLILSYVGLSCCILRWLLLSGTSIHGGKALKRLQTVQDYGLRLFTGDFTGLTVSIP